MIWRLFASFGVAVAMVLLIAGPAGAAGAQDSRTQESQNQGSQNQDSQRQEIEAKLTDVKRTAWRP